MPHLDLRETPAGPRYFLDGQPLAHRDTIDLKTERDSEGWTHGRFLWNGNPASEPWIQCPRYGHRLSTTDEIRKVAVEHSPPSVSPVDESRDTLNVWEQRPKG
jgi:hypothetical protein